MASPLAIAFTPYYEGTTLFLSSIFEWYERDFLDWYEARSPGQEGTLLNYATLYLPARRADELRRRAASYQVRFMPDD